jgi:L-histidine N-alpha-methyltransferase
MSKALIPSLPSLYETTHRTLQSEPKELPPVWLYDERGSLLYEEITRLPEYYLPRREAEILRAHAGAIAEQSRARTLVEFGSGGAKNTRLLLDALPLERFVPFDVSERMLQVTATTISAAYPKISVEPIAGDFQRDLDALPSEGPRLLAILGSTIGNLYPEQQAELLGALARELGEDDALLLGIDLVKDAARLDAAYRDPTGVTEAFVRNAMTAVNRELDATFHQPRFAYDPRWDPAHEWMDIGLRALEAHCVSVPRLDLILEFEAGERLRVEVSSKFRHESFEHELALAGLLVESWWTDRAGDFAVVLSTPAKEE